MEAITYGHWVQEEKTICRRKYSSFGKFSRHTPTNCFKIRNKLYKLYNANQLVLTMHVRERLTNYLYIFAENVKTWCRLMKVFNEESACHIFSHISSIRTSKCFKNIFPAQNIFSFTWKRKRASKERLQTLTKAIGSLLVLLKSFNKKTTT